MQERQQVAERDKLPSTLGAALRTPEAGTACILICLESAGGLRRCVALIKHSSIKQCTGMIPMPIHFMLFYAIHFE